MADETKEKFRGWAVLELMGHRRLGGFVEEMSLAGCGVLRIDIPGEKDGETYATQYYPPGSMYCLTPCSESAARCVAKQNRPRPVQDWELPRLPERSASSEPEDDAGDDEQIY